MIIILDNVKIENNALYATFEEERVILYTSKTYTEVYEEYWNDKLTFIDLLSDKQANISGCQLWIFANKGTLI
jgi:hypothetical protein